MGATTLVSIVSRLVIYHIGHQEILATALANIIGILFAFLTNDTIVFKTREEIGQPVWLSFLSRLSTLCLDILLTYFFVTAFPDLIGQFVEFNIDRVNTIETILAQIFDHHFKLYFQ